MYDVLFGFMIFVEYYTECFPILQIVLIITVFLCIAIVCTVILEFFERLLQFCSIMGGASGWHGGSCPPVPYALTPAAPPQSS